MDVRLPDGTVVTNVPEGTTKAQLMQKLQKSNPVNPLRPFDRTPPSQQQYASPTPNDPGMFERMRQQVAGDASAIEKENTSFVDRVGPFDLKKGLPFAGGLVGSALGPGGTTMGALAGSSLMAGGGATIGELLRQKLSDDQVSLPAAVKEGAVTAAGNMAGGVALKGLGMLANKLFVSPLDDAAKAGAQFARDKGAPFPLSSAAPSSPASMLQKGTRATLLGEIKTKSDANKVAQFINREVSTISAGANVFDDAARQGQQFLRQVFEPGETAIKNTFQAYKKAVGEITPIPPTNTLEAIGEVAQKLKNRGISTGAFAQKLNTILREKPQAYTPDEWDSLWGEVVKLGVSKASTHVEGQAILNAMTRDLDEFGRMSGVNFADDMAKSNTIREQFRDLRDIPQLKKLASEIGDRKAGGTVGTIDWMNSLFSSGNGKALAKLRELNPQMYHDLADAWIGKQISNFSKPSQDGIGQVFNGPGFREWFVSNEPKIREIFGSQQAKAYDGFSLYAQHMAGAVKRAEQPGMQIGEFSKRALGELALTGVKVGGVGLPAGSPFLVGLSEPAAFVLARGLSDPSSSLFRLFTEGVKPSTMKFLEASSKIGGQSTARGNENGKEQR